MDPAHELLFRYQFLLNRAAEYRLAVARQATLHGGFGHWGGIAQAMLSDEAAQRTLMQQLAAMNPLLQAGSALPVPSPRARSSVEEELALQALQNLKHDPRSSNSEKEHLAAFGGGALAGAFGPQVGLEKGLTSSDASSHEHEEPRRYAPGAVALRRADKAEPRRSKIFLRLQAEREAMAAAGFLPQTAPAPPPPSKSAKITLPDSSREGDGNALGGRSYVKRHEHWRSGLAVGGDGGEHPSAEATGGSDDARKEKPRFSGTPAARHGAASPGSTSEDEDEDATGMTSGGGCGVRSELAKEWAALTTWVRMNLHQPRTAKRKVLFVGHHPTLHPVPGAEANVRPRAAAAGTKRAAEEAEEPRARKTQRREEAEPSRFKLRERRREEEDFVFVLNPELRWSDVGHDTRVRMRTLVEETMDIFGRKYAKRRPEDWEKKLQKYRPPGTGKTFNVPLGNVVRGIQDAYFLFSGEDADDAE